MACLSVFLWADKTYISLILGKEAMSRMLLFFLHVMPCSKAILFTVSKQRRETAIATEMLEGLTHTRQATDSCYNCKASSG